MISIFTHLSIASFKVLELVLQFMRLGDDIVEMKILRHDIDNFVKISLRVSDVFINTRSIRK